jgi:sugar O-acyltransferase (sialic acid O-acetyltransferase NeuD family)
VTPIIILGAGGQGRVVLELIREGGDFAVVGFLDKVVSGSIHGVPVLGDDDLLAALRAQGIAHLFIALGHNSLRQKLGEKARLLGFTQPALIHVTAHISPSARVAEGALVMARAMLGTDARLEKHAILNTGAIADHDVVLGPASHVAPGCALAGEVSVGARSLVGVGSAVRPGMQIGADATIGAGSAVVTHIADGARVGGVPARPLRTRA